MASASGMSRASLKGGIALNKKSTPASSLVRQQPTFRLRFYVNSKKWNIRDELKKQINLMDEKDVNYVIFDDPELLLPMMSYEGIVVTGSGNITSAIARILK